MTQHLMVEVDSSGTSVVYVPLFRLWNFCGCYPWGWPQSPTTTRPSGSGDLPGLRSSIAQQIVDAALIKDGDLSEPERPC